MHSLVVLSTPAALDAGCPASLASGQEPLLGRSLLEHALELGVAAACSRAFVWTGDSLASDGSHEGATSWPAHEGLPVRWGAHPSDWLSELVSSATTGDDALLVGVSTPLLSSLTLARLTRPGEDQPSAALVDANGRTLALRVSIARLAKEWSAGELPASLDAIAERVGVLRRETVEGPQSHAVTCFETLCEASEILRSRIVIQLLRSGVRIDHPESTYVECGASVEPGARIEPFTVIRRGVHVAAGCSVGPFAHLRPGTRLEAGASVGNFVEIKAARLGRGAKARHLSYVGDADVGEAVNLGAGTIFANYDGKKKHHTVVKDRAFVGSGSILVAPVTIGEGATTGAGAVVLRGRDVADGDIVVGVPAKSVKTKA